MRALVPPVHLMKAAGALLAILPKAATRQRKKRTSDSEDEDYVAEEEATSKRVEPAQGTKPGLKIKRPAGRQPMSRLEPQLRSPLPKSQL